MEKSPSQSRPPRRSVRLPKRKDDFPVSESKSQKKLFRPCQKAGCPCQRPSCFAKAASGCVKDGYTSRWYHLSNSEHFCNECFEHFYRSHKDGNQIFTDWKQKLATVYQKELSIKLFFAEEILDYWAVCPLCKKWRKVPDSFVSNGIVSSSWQCSEAVGCLCVEDQPMEVDAAKSVKWIDTLSYLPLLKFSSPFSVLNEYYPDGIGFSTMSMKNGKPDGFSDLEKKYIQPFYSPGGVERAGSFLPSMMLPDEKEAFPELVKLPTIFLGLRNMALSLWTSNYKEYLSLEKCTSYVVVRGLVRVTICEILQSVLDFLTVRGRINFGFMSKVPRDTFLNTEHFKGSVIVIGAGCAGLSAGFQLKRAGCQVKVLEARSEIGGRVKDDVSLGICISQGPQIITGCINNPIYIICKQMNLPLRILRQKCNLIDQAGELISEPIDQKVELYFNLMLESTEELKETEKTISNKLSLKDCLSVRKDDLEMQIFRELTEVEGKLLHFHMANLEYACGAPLERVSALHWNQNESMLQFDGEHAWMEKGFGPVIEAFAEGLDIQLRCEVTEVDFSGDRVQVKDHNGNEFTADKAIVTVPLSVLKKETIRFIPALTDTKKSSISNLGAGVIEKVMLAFNVNFWKEKVGEADFFGRIPDTEKDRGLACLFYDVSFKETHALVALIVGDAVNRVKTLSDSEILECCLEKLRNMFPDEKIPEPHRYFVSHWNSESHIEMTYSYVGVNGSGVDFDNLAESVDGKLYFAGEATNRRVSQTVTGAFISGLREARKILVSKT